MQQHVAEYFVGGRFFSGAGRQAAPRWARKRPPHGLRARVLSRRYTKEADIDLAYVSHGLGERMDTVFPRSGG
jgi:hypothetical protein